MRLNDIYEANEIVIDRVFVLCMSDVPHSKCRMIVFDYKSSCVFQGPNFPAGFGRLHVNLCWSQREEFHSLSLSLVPWIISALSLFLQPLALPAPPLPPVVSSCSYPTYLFGYISKML